MPLIIDLRRNGGGQPAMIAYVLSYVFDEPTHLNDIYERVGNRTQQWWTMPHVPGLKFGAASPYSCSCDQRLHLLGRRGVRLQHPDPEAGHAHRRDHRWRGPPRAASEGHRALHDWRPVRPRDHPITGTNWEGTGVTPDIAAPAADALDLAHTMAIERILEKATDPDERQMLQQLLSERKAKKGNQ